MRPWVQTSVPHQKKKKVIGSGTGQDLRNEGKKGVTSNLIIDVGI
jgi:hypothetical protein